METKQAPAVFIQQLLQIDPENLKEALAREHATEETAKTIKRKLGALYETAKAHSRAVKSKVITIDPRLKYHEKFTYLRDEEYEDLLKALYVDEPQTAYNGDAPEWEAFAVAKKPYEDKCNEWYEDFFLYCLVSVNKIEEPGPFDHIWKVHEFGVQLHWPDLFGQKQVEFEVYRKESHLCNVGRTTDAFYWKLKVDGEEIINSTKDVVEPDLASSAEIDQKQPLCDGSIDAIYHAFAMDPEETKRLAKDILQNSKKKPTEFPIPIATTVENYVACFSPSGFPVTVDFIAHFFKQLLIDVMEFEDDSQYVSPSDDDERTVN